MPFKIDIPAADLTFDEAGYLLLNPDVANKVSRDSPGHWASGRQHFDVVGHREPRQMRRLAAIQSARREKLARLAPYLLDLPCRRHGDKLDFLSDHLRLTSGIQSTNLIAQNGYDNFALQLISDNKDGLILDCGSGFRPIYYENVVNYEIVDYDTTDVIGVGEALPFADGTFDGVLSLSVLEHVRDPFQCAAEIRRVLKPGGKLVCSAPFLAPYHGYPHHYFNMTHQGLRSLFEENIEVEFHEVIDSLLPVWSLTWIVQTWAAALDEESRAAFLDQPLAVLLNNPGTLIDKPWVRALPRTSNLELAAGTLLIGRKRLT